MNKVNSNDSFDLFSPTEIEAAREWPDYKLVLGDALAELKQIEDSSTTLVLSSPPYNLGKEYERKVGLSQYLESMRPILEQIYRTLSDNGNVAWQVGNFVEDGEVFPLDIYYYPMFKDIGFKLRNRVIWHFDHGLHASKRLSGRYESILWFSKTDDYVWNLDPIRVPSKYPGKRVFKPGPRYGLPSGNPLGKNPSDFWKVVEHDWDREIWEIPNVKANHPEKTFHPCSFPIELAERCILALTQSGDRVLDPFCGVGSAVIAALKNGRPAVGIDRDHGYLEVASSRISQLKSGNLPYRELGKPIHKPGLNDKISQVPEEWKK